MRLSMFHCNKMLSHLIESANSIDVSECSCLCRCSHAHFLWLSSFVVDFVAYRLLRSSAHISMSTRYCFACFGFSFFFLHIFARDSRFWLEGRWGWVYIYTRVPISFISIQHILIITRNESSNIRDPIWWCLLLAAFIQDTFWIFCREICFWFETRFAFNSWRAESRGMRKPL